MGLVDTLPVQRVRPVLFLPLWLGTQLDKSDTGHTINVVGDSVTWAESTTDGVQCTGSGRLVAPHSEELSINNGTILIFGDLCRHVSGTTFARKLGPAGRYHFYLTSQIVFFDGTSASSVNQQITGSKSVAVTFESGQKPEFFLDGSSIGLGSTVQNIPATDQDLDILGYGAGAVNCRTSLFILYNEALTETEVSLTHDYCDALITPRLQWPAQGLDYAGDTFTGEPKYVDNIQSARVSLANETNGRLSNTGLSIMSGTWRVAENASGRNISCVADGVLRRKLVDADTYTTARFVETGGVVLTKASRYIQFAATAGDTISALVLTAP